jgi:hypothetical protein
MRGKNLKKHRVHQVKPAPLRITEGADVERETLAISTRAAQLPVFVDRARFRAEINAFIVTLRDNRNQVAITSALLLASPLKPPHDLTLFKFASELNNSSRTLLYRCKLDLLRQ